MKRAASPKACAPVAQAVDTECNGPWKPCVILTCPEAMLTKIFGTKKGLTFRYDFWRAKVAAVVSLMLPMPDPMHTPVLSRASKSSSVGFQLASLSASCAATRA
eukprot:Lithocolla_globosa_v1_NODE_1378_length_2621_cov_6.806703.p3 type:complete len:104 gc:universal NODE_1378_length_2621_cov_6.806703:1697-1386(-)